MPKIPLYNKSIAEQSGYTATSTPLANMPKVSAKAQTIRTLLQAEMNKLEKGRQCLAGYSSFNQKKPKLKNHTA